MVDNIFKVLIIVALAGSGYSAMKVLQLSDQLASVDTPTANQTVSKTPTSPSGDVAKLEKQISFLQNKVNQLSTSNKTSLKNNKPTSSADYVKRSEVNSIVDNKIEKKVAEIEAREMDAEKKREAKNKPAKTLAEAGERLNIDANKMNDVRTLFIKREDFYINMMKKEDETIDDFIVRAKATEGDDDAIEKLTEEVMKAFRNSENWAKMGRMEREYKRELNRLLGEDTASSFQRITSGMDKDFVFEER